MGPSGNASLERLLDRTSEREQPLLDENGHFADEIHRLAALLEDTRVPFHAIGQFVDSALVGIRPVLKFAQLENRGADLVGKFPLFASISLDSPHHVTAFIIEGLEQAGKYQSCLFLPLGFAARDDVCNRPLRVIEGRAARSKPADQIPDRWHLPPKRSPRMRLCTWPDGLLAYQYQTNCWSSSVTRLLPKEARAIKVRCRGVHPRRNCSSAYCG
jgi:hypothetical protein